jgi:ribonuclease D
MHIYKNDLPQDLELKGDIAIDTETTGLNFARDRLCLIQISNGDDNAHLVSFENGKYDAPNLKRLLSNKNIVKIFHFARFDVGIIKKFLGVNLTNIYCTKIASRFARTYTDCHGLKDLCRELLNVTISKQQQSSYWGASSLSQEQLAYAASDVVYLHKLREKLDEILAREGRDKLVKECFDFLPHRVELDLSGWGEVDIFAYK